MKPLVKTAKTNLPKQRVNKTPKGGVKAMEAVESMQPITGKLQQMDSLKPRTAKADKRPKGKHESACKENTEHQTAKRLAESPSALDANRCIEQIEQELYQLKRLTRIKRASTPLTSSPISGTKHATTLVSKLYELIQPLLSSENAELATQIKVILKRIKHSVNDRPKVDQIVQTIEGSNKKAKLAVEYEKKIAEMKISVYEMKEQMSDLEALYKADNEKVAKLESELRLTKERLAESQRLLIQAKEEKISRKEVERQNERLRLIIKDQEKVIKQLQARQYMDGSQSSESSQESPERPLQLKKTKGKIIYATMQNDVNNSSGEQEVTIVDDTTKNEEKLVVRTQDENYGWRSFDVSADMPEPSRAISAKDTAKFMQTDTERQHIKRTEVLRDEIVALDQEIGKLHKTISQE